MFSFTTFVLKNYILEVEMCIIFSQLISVGEKVSHQNVSVGNSYYFFKCSFSKEMYCNIGLSLTLMYNLFTKSTQFCFELILLTSPLCQK